jgi:hypothetical protein
MTGRANPKRSLLDATEHIGPVPPAADGELIEIQILHEMEHGDAISQRSSLFFCWKQPKISPSDVTRFVL